MLEDARARLALLGGFELTIDGESVEMPPGSQRVLAYLGVAGGRSSRGAVLGTLWPDREERRAAANLRSAIWRLPSEARWVVGAAGTRMQLASGVQCDVADLVDQARRVLDGNDGNASALQLTPLLDDLLPSWYEDWVLVERERLRQLRVHALEAVATRLTDAGKFGEAMEAALAAVGTEPLRESAQRCLLAVHLAEGNAHEAVRQYEGYQRLLRDNLGIEPGPTLQAMINTVIRR